MKCKLCLENDDIQESHIIPDAFFRFVKDNKENIGRYIEISDNSNKLGQVSYSEKLLCRECEAKFNTEFEAYVIAFLLHNPNNIGVSSKKSIKQMTFTNLDYGKLKLFQMSLLWRAAISSLDFYKHVQVEPEILEKLRKNLFDLDPLEPHMLPCFMDRVFLDSPTGDVCLHDIRQSKSIIIKPKKTVNKLLGIEYVTFIFGGFEWRFWLHKCTEYYVDESKVVSQSGTLICPIVDIQTNKLLLDTGVLARRNMLKGKSIK